MGESSAEIEKHQKIIEKLTTDKDDVDFYRSCAYSTFGLVNNRVRKLVWPILLKIDEDKNVEFPSEEEQKSHKEYRQVVLDVERMRSLLPKDATDEEFSVARRRTLNLIMSILCKQEHLHYYQGFHDICYIFSSIFDDKTAFLALKKLTSVELKSFMSETMDSTEEYLMFIYVLLNLSNPRLLLKLENAEIQSTFALSWVLTWFTHVLPDTQSIIRLYDIFLADEDNMMCIYATVAVILLSIAHVEEIGQDFGELYQCLTQLPKRHSVEKIVETALQIYKDFPPMELQREASKLLSNDVNKQIIKKSNIRLTSRGQFAYFMYQYRVPFMIRAAKKNKYALSFVITSLSAALYYSFRYGYNG